MNGESGAAPAFDLRAVGTGVLWGVGLMALGAAAQGIYAYGSPLSSGAEALAGPVWRTAGAFLGGFMAARRAAGSGWLHGALAGLGMLLPVSLVMGVIEALPGMMAALKVAGLGTAAGIVGGVLGVNMGR